jgi:hypothetical protein
VGGVIEIFSIALITLMVPFYYNITQVTMVKDSLKDSNEEVAEDI